jgi:hypothetical protein
MKFLYGYFQVHLKPDSSLIHQVIPSSLIHARLMPANGFEWAAAPRSGSPEGRKPLGTGT